MNSILIKFNPFATQSDIASACSPLGKVLRTSRLLKNLVTLTLSDGITMKEAIESVKKNSFVEYAEENISPISCLVPTDPSETINVDAMAFLNAPEAWDITTGDGSIIVAVLESAGSVDGGHEDLSANMWSDPNYSGNAYGYDFVNDGWSFPFTEDASGTATELIPVYQKIYYQTSTSTYYRAVQDTPDGFAKPFLISGELNTEYWEILYKVLSDHASFIAGIIGAVGNNGLGVAGVCWDVKIMSCMIGSISDDIEAIEFAINRGAKVINMSHMFTGISYPTALDAAITAAGEAGVLVVCAAGNDGVDIDEVDVNGGLVSPRYPANLTCENLLTVGACKTDRTIAIGFDGSSAVGADSVDLFAPGGAGLTGPDASGGYDAPSWGGTSSASAFVSGAAALMKMANQNLHWKDIKAILLNTGGQIISPNYINTPENIQVIRLSVSDKILNLYEAVLSASTATVWTAALDEQVPGRKVELRKVQRQDGKYDVEVDVEWAQEQTLHDNARTTAVPNVDEAGETLPRTGTAVVDQWWEKGVNTDKLPSKPASIYDDASGLWVESYEMQSPPEMLPNGRYNWLMNCRRISLPSAMVENIGTVETPVYAPKWIQHSINRETRKKAETIAQAGQQVMRLMNGLIDDPSVVTNTIPWVVAWDWDVAEAGYVLGDIRYYDVNNHWYKATGAVPTGTLPTDTDYWAETVDEPAGWDSVTYGAWDYRYRKTYIDAYTGPSNITWNADWTNNINTTSNSDASWTASFPSDTWLSRFYPSTPSFSGSSLVAAGDVCAHEIPAAGTGTSASKTISTHTSGTNLNYGYKKFAKAEIDQYGSYGVGTVFTLTAFGTWIAFKVCYTDGTNVLVLFLSTEKSLFLASGTLTIYKPSTATYYAKTVSRDTRTEVVGLSLMAGTLLYDISENSSTPESWVFADNDIGEATGYPYLFAPAVPVNFYTMSSFLTDPQRAPRFGFYDNKYSNPNMVEIVRRTKTKIDSIIYRKYCAVHPHMLSSTSAFIPAAFAEDSGTWPSDGYWLDSNTKISFKVADNIVNMLGAQLYFVECIIEFTGEQKADVTEESARENEGGRNYPEVDPDTGLAMIYYTPPEVDSLFGPNTLEAGQSRQQPSRFGTASKMVETFEVRAP